MNGIREIKEKNAVLVPIKDWEKIQKELMRLRKQVNKARILTELKAEIISIKEDVRNGKSPKGKAARTFVKELVNEK